jgi:DNA-directed RNA polymerase specialized sigma24 family protein
MSGDDQGSVTGWIERVKRGDSEAAERLWERYFGRLVALARGRLSARRGTRAVADEEDAALSALDSFYQRAGRDKFPRLNNRDDLWRLLVVMTARKVSDHINHERRARRGRGLVVRESDLAGSDAELGPGFDRFLGREPTPEFVALMADEYEYHVGKLDEAIRPVAVLRLEGLSTDEIAGRLGCTPRNVRYKLEFIRKTWSQDPG